MNQRIESERAKQARKENVVHLIHDSTDRAKREQEKKDTILRLLRTEIYTRPMVLGELLGIGKRAIRNTIESLEKDGLVKRHSVRPMSDMESVVVVGITERGQSLAFDPANGEAPVDRYFDPKKYSLMQLQHHVDTQRLRIAAEGIGYVEEWLPGSMLGARKKGEKHPDVVVYASFGQRIAIEVERSIKSPKRYRSIFRYHLESLSSGKWHWVVWVSPTESISDRVRALVLPEAEYENGAVDLLAERHREQLFFCDYKNFVACLQNIESLVYPSVMPEE